jgi:hypothetical protein
MRTALLVAFLCAAVQSAVACAVETPRAVAVWENVCSAVFEALANRIDMNVGQQQRAQMLRARAGYVSRVSERHWQELQLRVEQLREIRWKLVQAYEDDEPTLRSAVADGSPLKSLCEELLRFNISQSGASVSQVHQAICGNAR